ncbi:hypothetical protein HPB47_000416, partial [Ixodes persulcatus]
PCIAEAAQSRGKRRSRLACDTRTEQARDSEEHPPRGKTNRLISMALGQRHKSLAREVPPSIGGPGDGPRRAEPEVGSRSAFPSRITTTRKEFG